MIQISPNNPNYWINSRALSFSENDLDDPMRVAVSLVSGTVVKAYVKGAIELASDGNYEQWTLKGYSTLLVEEAAHHIYARLNRSDRTALVVFSVKDYNVDGSITKVIGKDEDGKDITETSEPSADYFYIKIGHLTETVLRSDRELTYDSGKLGTDGYMESNSTLDEMFRLVKTSVPWLIEAQQMFSDFTVKGFIKLIGGLKFSKGKEGDEKIITDVKRSIDGDDEFLLDEDGHPMEDEGGNPLPNPDYVPVSDETIPTTAWVSEKFSGITDDRYLRKDQDDATPFILGVGALDFQEKPIRRFIRYYDEEKPEYVSDADFYSALMTDKRIEQEFGDLDKRYIRKDFEDTAHKHITFEEGITVYQLAKLMNLEVEELATIARYVIKAGEGQDEHITSPVFVDGFAGEGLKIWHDLAAGDWNMTLDNLTVRKMMTVYELVIHKIRAVGGMLVISAADGKIKEVEKIGAQYKITFEDENMFVVNDLMRCQVWTGSGIKYYWVEVSGVAGNSVYVLASEFGTAIPEPGDDVVLMGNTRDKKRQNMLLLSATDDGQPRFECHDNIKSKTFTGTIRAVVGCLDGISDYNNLPDNFQPEGYGLYADNCYLKGKFILSTGEDVATRFSVMEGQILAELSSVRAEINAKDNYLNNASFAEGMRYWEYDSDIRMFSTSGGLLHFNENFYSVKNEVAGPVTKDSKLVLRLKDSFIRQKNQDFRLRPTFEEYEQEIKDEEGNFIPTGEKKFRPTMFYVSFKYMCVSPGTLRVYFEGESNDGTFEEYEPIVFPSANDQNEGNLSSTSGFSVMEVSGKWNGTGDFYLSFTGDIYIYDLALAANSLADMEERWSNRIEITDRKIQANLEHTMGKLNEYRSEFLLTAEELQTTFSYELRDAEGRITDAYESMIEQTAKSLTSEYKEYVDETMGEYAEEYDSRLSQTAREIEALVRKDTEIDGRFTKAEAALQIHADEISSKVSQFDYNQKTGEIEGSISEVNQRANEITQSVADTNQRIDLVQGTLNDAVEDIEQLDKDADAFKKEMQDFMYDGVIEVAEAAAIEKYINTLDAQMTEINATYDKIYNHQYLKDSTNTAVRTALYNAKNSLTLAYSSLVSAIRSSISDGKTTTDESAAVDTAFNNFDNAITRYYQALQDARDAITGFFGKKAVELAEQNLYNALPSDWKTDEGTYASALVQMAEGLSLVAVNFDDNGRPTKQSGILVTSDFVDMFSERMTAENVVVRSELSTYVTEDDLGNPYSGIEISADLINLNGVVTYSMLNGSLRDILDDKATSDDIAFAQSELNNSIGALNNTISSLQTEVNKKASIDSLNSKVTELNNALSGKLTGSTSTSGGRLYDAVINGSTLIAGGFIDTDYIKAGELEVGKLKAVNGSYTYTLNSNGFTVESTTSGTLCQLYASSSLTMLNMNGTQGSVVMSPHSLTYTKGTGVVGIDGEKISLNGGAYIHPLALKTGTSLGTYGFAVLGYAQTLPKASSSPGMVIFTKTTGEYKINTVSGDKIQERGSYSSAGTTGGITRNKSAQFFISDGNSTWYEFFCGQ